MALIARARPQVQWLSTLGRLQHTFSQLPTDWRKLGVRAARASAPRVIHDCGTSRTPFPFPNHAHADYTKLEVFDSMELKSLEALLSEERARVVEKRELAKEQQRKVLRVDCDLDLKRIDRINKWVEHIHKDTRRTW